MTSIIGGWGRRLPPYPGELLTSCLIRNAAAHGLTAYRFFSLICPGADIWNRDFDRDPALLGTRSPEPGRPTWPEVIAARLGTEPDLIEDATLAGWREHLVEESARYGDTSLILSAGVHHRNRKRHGLVFCATCLSDGTAYFRKTWRLAFAVTCDMHGTALRDACPHCDAPVIPHRTMTMRLTDCHACGQIGRAHV